MRGRGLRVQQHTLTWVPCPLSPPSPALSTAAALGLRACPFPPCEAVLCCQIAGRQQARGTLCPGARGPPPQPRRHRALRKQISGWRPALAFLLLCRLLPFPRIPLCHGRCRSADGLLGGLGGLCRPDTGPRRARELHRRRPSGVVPRVSLPFLSFRFLRVTAPC